MAERISGLLQSVDGARRPADARRVIVKYGVQQGDSKIDQAWMSKIAVVLQARRCAEGVRPAGRGKADATGLQLAVLARSGENVRSL